MTEHNNSTPNDPQSSAAAPAKSSRRKWLIGGAARSLLPAGRRACVRALRGTLQDKGRGGEVKDSAPSWAPACPDLRRSGTLIAHLVTLGVRE